MNYYLIRKFRIKTSLYLPNCLSNRSSAKASMLSDADSLSKCSSKLSFGAQKLSFVADVLPDVTFTCSGESRIPRVLFWPLEGRTLGIFLCKSATDVCEMLFLVMKSGYYESSENVRSTGLSVQK